MRESAASRERLTVAHLPHIERTTTAELQAVGPRKSSIISRILNSAAGAGAMAALPYSMAATGDPNLMVAGMAATVVNAALLAHVSGRIEANREELSRRTEVRLDRL